MHTLVSQLFFVRQKWQEGFQGLNPDEAVERINGMNSLSWMMGHLAYHEHRMWVVIAQGREVAPEVEAYGWGRAASTPPLDAMWDIWNRSTTAADIYLVGLSEEVMRTHIEWKGKPYPENVGTMLLRNIYHYWYHLGEGQAIRQLLGHKELPSFVGYIPDDYYYRAEE
jgi:hypothetical protein